MGDNGKVVKIDIEKNPKLSAAATTSIPYNIINDPSESKNIIFGNEKLVEELLDELKIHKQKIVIKKSQLDLN